MKMITRTYIGGKDLYYGVPDLDKAEFMGAETIEDHDDFVTKLKFKLYGNENSVYEIFIKQGK